MVTHIFATQTGMNCWSWRQWHFKNILCQSWGVGTVLNICPPSQRRWRKFSSKSE